MVVGAVVVVGFAVVVVGAEVLVVGAVVVGAEVLVVGAVAAQPPISKPNNTSTLTTTNIAFPFIFPSFF